METLCELDHKLLTDDLSIANEKETNTIIDFETEYISRYSDILVLTGSRFRNLGYLAHNYKHAVSYLYPDGDIAFKLDREKSIDNYPLLIIPSGALSGMENNLELKNIIESYVNNGGTVFCMAQQRGNDFSVLPGNPGGYGWNEDQSCHKNAVYLEKYHPILSGITENPIDAIFDGYFTSYPLDSDILLRRTKNGYPAMVGKTWFCRC
ncbi:hypothetical protein KAU32_03435 [bacterium]|nr:hypothetical protein [bacterium]